MTFEQLHYFLEITEDMNFTKTANRLFVSQPTLSRQLAALEESLGAKLLNRDTRSVELTDAGRYLAQASRKLLKEKRAIEEEVWRLNEGLRGRINLVSVSMQTNRVYQLCYRFQIRHPDFALNLSTQVHGTTAMQIEQDLADVAVGFSYELETPAVQLEGVPIQRDRFYLIVSEQHPLARKSSVCPADLQGETILIARQPMANRFCARVHTQLCAQCEMRREWQQPNTIDEMVMQVKAGMGLGILPGTNCRENEGYRALEIEGIPAEFDVVMVWRRNSGNPAMACFREVVREELGEPVPFG